VVEETPAPTTFEPPVDEPPDEPEAPEPEVDSDVSDGVEFEPVSEEDFEQLEVEEDEAGLDYDFEPESAPTEPESADTAFDPTATVRIDTTEGTPSAEEPPPPPAPAAPIPGPEGIDEPSAVELEAPPPVRPVEPPADISPGMGQAPDEDARQEEARRFARLLVSEIKLYNEDEVERGRVEKDISTRLREDIDRSREMYEKRIPEDVRSGHDYFYDELVRILADGDADALGM
jgi:hypothetical protein